MSGQDYQPVTDHLYTDTQLVDEDGQNRLIHAGSLDLVGVWIIGDEAARLCDTRPAGVTMERVRAAVGRFCGRSGETVRKYETMARFYSLEVRENYPALYTRHFLLAMWSGSLEAAVEWLNLAAAAGDHYGGRPMPVDVLEAKMRGAGQGGPDPDLEARPDTPDRLDWILAKLNAIRSTAYMDNKTQQAVGLAQYWLNQALLRSRQAGGGQPERREPQTRQAAGSSTQAPPVDPGGLGGDTPAMARMEGHLGER